MLFSLIPIVGQAREDFEQLPPGATYDRQCEPFTQCTDAQYEDKEPCWADAPEDPCTSDRKCNDLTVCDDAFEYESDSDEDMDA